MKNDITSVPAAQYRKDYQVPAFLIDTVHLEFDLGEEATRVKSRLVLHRNPAAPARGSTLRLDGEQLELISVTVDGRVLQASEYTVDAESLTIAHVPERFELQVETRIHPEKNTSLEGLYKSSGNFCTQCEAQGFRKITYYLDRPDVMAVFTTVVRGDAKRYPHLLSNGNRVADRMLPDGRREVTWNDPFRKPCYLFALVGGDLARVQDHFVTRSGRRITLEIYVNHGNENRTAHAMESLKRSMKWDEERFGLEYDLDLFMLVAVDDFNFGAMENKGLNIFNSRLVLASPESATDADFEAIEAVVGHEYFHNWSGNRVTCRDWFQLSLKEGLTVYRDSEFTADMTSRTVKRISDVAMLRARQFPEDAGPMAHPIRPDSYIEINNFYTATVYEKGSEVIRMIATLLGREGFRKGIDLYFKRHDGQAVTCEDFVVAMEDASGVKLDQFRNWYSQAGTPRLAVTGEYDAGRKTYALTVKQSTPATPGQMEKKPFQIPLAVALLDSQGKEHGARVLQVRGESETFVFEGVTEAPVPSLLREFSAPVHLDYPYTQDELLFLLAHDQDGFARWEAGQKLSLRTIQALLDARIQGGEARPDARYLAVFGGMLKNPGVDEGLAAELLTLPDQAYIEQIQTGPVHPDHVWHALGSLKREIGLAHADALKSAFEQRSRPEAYRYEAQAMGRRALKNTALAYLCRSGAPGGLGAALAQLKTAQNHTDEVSALRILSEHASSEREEAMAQFYSRWHKDGVVMNKWFAAQASSSVGDGLARVQGLLADPAFQAGNPNHVRSVLGAFANANTVHFHRVDGEGYRFFADQVLAIDAKNPSLAARLVSSFNQWKRFESVRKAKMGEALERLARHKLSPGTGEVVSKARLG